MRLSWKLGRIAGIDVFVHPTFLIVLLPGVLGGRDMIPLILALFGCVLLHEFGHALMARRFGIGTVDITLYPIGGVARLMRIPRAPGAEFLIAIAGPCVNFAIVAVLAAMGFFSLGSEGLSLDRGSFWGQLAVLNLGLGLFNLIPAFPMDGGRVLRAALAVPLGRSRATMIAARLGRILAIAFGIMAILVTHSVLHLILAVFIFLASRNEELQVLAEERRRAFGETDQSVWYAPPGYRWVDRGGGLWQLAPWPASRGASGSNRGM